MKRREFIAGLVTAAALTLAARAQPVKIRRVGFLGNSTAALEANLLEPFRQTLRDLGHVEGLDIVIDYPLGGRKPTNVFPRSSPS